MHEQILAKYPDAPLQVYTVWVEMLSGDARDARATRLMPDARVQHFWDVDHVAGRWFAQHQPWSKQAGPLAWDVFYLYGPEATWDDVPQPLVGSGSTIIVRRATLDEKIRPLIAEAAP